MHTVFENIKWLHSRCFGIKKAQSLPLLVFSLVTARNLSTNAVLVELYQGTGDQCSQHVVGTSLVMFIKFTPLKQKLVLKMESEVLYVLDLVET